LDEIDTSAVTSFTTSDTEELRRFYDSTYPGNWFDPRMLETGCYFGLRRDGVIAGVAGIHVYSTRYRVATLGNIATHPAYRNQGLGKQVIARLCQHLLNTTNYIGLNVRADNEPALYVYTCLGFTAMAEYDEYMITI
jgi:predicted GNAT family acetyltransferase